MADARVLAGVVEVEWQYDAPSLSSVSSWLQSAAVPGYSVVARGMKHLADTYYDTPGWRVHHAGYTCRVRNSGDTWVLTLKAMAAPKDGMRSRREIEHALPQVVGQPVFSGAGDAGAVLRSLAGSQPLRPLFALHTTRATYALMDRGGPMGEIVLDDTAVSSATEHGDHRLARIEVEVPADAVDRARPFVNAMVTGCGMTPATLSKFENGLNATSTVVEPLAPDLGPNKLRGTLPAAAYAVAVLRRFFGDMLQCEPGTRLGEDVEALHEMRVATRRLRAAFRTFRGLRPPDWERFRAEIGWVGATLGEVRDLDVQLAQVEAWEQELEEADAGELQPLADLLHNHRMAARGRMLEMLDSERYADLVEEFAQALRTAPDAGAESQQPPMRDVAGELVLAAYHRLRKRGDRIRASSAPAEYHRLRIDAKRLRYTVEFLSPLYGRAAREYLVRVRALQDQLGLHQDAEVAVDHIRQLAFASAERLGPGTLLAMGAASERYRTRAVELRRQFPGTYTRLSGRRWQRLRRRIGPR